MRDFAELTCEGIDFDKLTNSSTFVPLETAMILQRSIHESNIPMIWDSRGCDANGNELPETTHYCRKSWPSILYPVQKNDRYGAYFPALFHCKTRPASNTSMLWIVSALLTRTESLWQAIVKIKGLRQSRWHGWMLTWLTKKNFKNLATRNAMKNDPFKFSFIKSNKKMFDMVKHDLFADENTAIVFEDVDNVLCVDTFNEVHDNIDENKHDIIIIGKYIHTDDSTFVSIPETIDSNGKIYELRVFMKMMNSIDCDDDNWDSHVYSRHGKRLSSWWYQSKGDEICTHCSGGLPQLDIDDSIVIIAVYVKLKELNVNSLNYEFLQYIGGQSHVFCDKHNLPLIVSAVRKKKCNCGRKEHFTCPTLKCHSCICKRCSDEKDRQSIFRVVMNEEANDDDINEHNDSDNESLIEPYFEEVGNNLEDNLSEIDVEIDEEEIEKQNNVRNDDDILEKEDFDEFITSSESPDITDDSDFQFDPIPTTDTGEFVFEVVEEKMLKEITSILT